MDLRFHAAVGTLVFIGIISCAVAQDGQRAPTSAASEKTPRSVLTGKERLGQKWTDEQRIDNCHVPADKRGTRRRPSACPNDPAS